MGNNQKDGYKNIEDVIEHEGTIEFNLKKTLNYLGINYIGKKLQQYVDFLSKGYLNVEMKEGMYIYSEDNFYKSDREGYTYINVFSDAVGGHSDIFKLFDTYEGRMREGFVPIGENYGGDIICVSTVGKDEGSIYIWDHDFEMDNNWNRRYDNIYKVSNCFNELVKRARHFEEEELDTGNVGVSLTDDLMDSARKFIEEKK